VVIASQRSAQSRRPDDRLREAIHWPRAGLNFFVASSSKIDTDLHVPTMFIRLLKLPEEVRKKYDTSSLPTVVDAAAPCPRRGQRADDRMVHDL